MTAIIQVPPRSSTIKRINAHSIWIMMTKVIFQVKPSTLIKTKNALPRDTTQMEGICIPQYIPIKTGALSVKRPIARKGNC